MSRCRVTRVQLTGRYKIACAGRRITKLTATIKCTSAPVIETNGVEVMHVSCKRTLYPSGAHDYKDGQSGHTGIFSEVSYPHLLAEEHCVVHVLHPGV